MGPLTLPLISAGASLLGQGVNALATTGANRASEQFQLRMYDRQRADALADWNRNNEYNSPLQQMMRFKEAGLNPNLIYGQTNTAQPVRSSQSGSYRADPVQFDFGSVLGKFMEVQLQTAQLNNQEKLLDLRKQEEELKKLQINYKANTLGTDIKLREEQLRNVQMNTVTGWNRDNREWTRSQLEQNKDRRSALETDARIKVMGQQILHSQASIREMATRIEKMGKEMELTHRQTQAVILGAFNMIKTGKIQDLEIKAAEQGLSKTFTEKVITGVLDVGGDIIRARMRK